MEIVRTVEEWEAEIGAQIRTVRMLAGISQTLKTLVALVRSLDRTEWLEQLSPLITISPMQMLRDQQRQKPRQRVYAPRPRPRSGQGSGADPGADLGPAQKRQSAPRSRN
jgi:hypothetical protein